jgi:nuclear transport factor 2 (NTF2) superfamily protein
MGSWNKTCGLSRLHITAGEPVYVFVLEKGKDSSDRCYSTALFSPLLLPFESVYDDYGGGEDSSGPGLELILNGLRKNLIEMEQGENEYHDIHVKSDGFDATKFFEAVHEGRLSVKGWRGEPNRVDFVMIRKDVAQHIFDTWEREHYVGNGKGTGGWGNDYVFYKFADVLADIPAFMDRLESKLKDDGDLVESAGDEKAAAAIRRMNLRFRLYDGLASMYAWEERDQNKVSWYMMHDTFYRYSSIVHIHEAIVDLVEQGKRQEAEELLTEHLKAVYIDSFYHATRNVWAPGCHEGSQSQDHDGYRVLVSAITKVLDAEKVEYDKENGEE